MFSISIDGKLPIAIGVKGVLFVSLSISFEFSIEIAINPFAKLLATPVPTPKISISLKNPVFLDTVIVPILVGLDSVTSKLVAGVFGVGLPAIVKVSVIDASAVKIFVELGFALL